MEAKVETSSGEEEMNQEEIPAGARRQLELKGSWDEGDPTLAGCLYVGFERGKEELEVFL